MVNFNIAQTFTVDPSLVDGNDTAKITSIDLFMKYKPPATNNRSGVNNPGMTMYLTETIFNVPKITNDTYSQFARAEWSNIITSSDASVPTKFKFSTPVLVKPGKTYAILLSFDGNETFWPWIAKTGKTLVGTNTIFSGTVANFVGQYFEFYATDPSVDPTTAVTQAQYQSFWRPLDGTDLKFEVFVARYTINGVPVASANLDLNIPIFKGTLIETYDPIANTITFNFPVQNYEQVAFDINTSNVSSFIGAQKVFQNTVCWPGGFANGSDHISVSCNSSQIIVANTLYPNGATFHWTDCFSTYTGSKYITLFGNTTSLIDVRKVTGIISNTQIQVSEPTTFTNAAAKFLISPIATIDAFNPISPRGKKEAFMFLSHSTANSTLRFVNNCIEAITVGTNAGNGYNNSDIILINGYENVPGKVIGGYPAVANIVTNGTGAVTAVYLSNQGCGFTNTSTIHLVIANSAFVINTLANSTANSANNSLGAAPGSGLTLTYSVGATLRTELTTNSFKSCEFVNLDLNDMTAYYLVNSPTETAYSVSAYCQYYVVNDANTSCGFAYYVNPAPDTLNLQLFTKTKLNGNIVPVFVSYSNEFITSYSNGAINDKVSSLSYWSNNAVIKMATHSNSDFSAVSVLTPPTVEFGKYVINNDYTFEETNSGNAYARHLTSLINFGRLSEDIRVYLTAYRPSNTDIQVYAKVKNSGDPQPFDDEDWTRLQILTGTDLRSSMTKEDDYIELTYGFQAQPNTAYNIPGTVVTVNAQANVTMEAGYTWSTGNSTFAVGTLVKIYDPLFPNTNFFVSSINAISSSTVLVLDHAITSNDNIALVSNGLKIDVLGYPHQAYNDAINDNIVTYYNQSTVNYDGYDNLSIKIVLLSDHLSHIPRIHNIRGIGISA